MLISWTSSLLSRTRIVLDDAIAALSMVNTELRFILKGSQMILKHMRALLRAKIKIS